jgi:hypothetical protein
LYHCICLIYRPDGYISPLPSPPNQNALVRSHTCHQIYLKLFSLFFSLGWCAARSNTPESFYSHILLSAFDHSVWLICQPDEGHPSLSKKTKCASPQPYISSDQPQTVQISLSWCAGGAATAPPQDIPENNEYDDPPEEPPKAKEPAPKPDDVNSAAKLSEVAVQDESWGTLKQVDLRAADKSPPSHEDVEQVRELPCHCY